MGDVAGSDGYALSPMLIYAYLFAMLLGGILLGASILLGGKDGDVDGDGDVDAADAELDLDGDGDLDGDFDADADHGVDKAIDFGDGGDFFLWSLRSVRFWTFFLAFFGLSGLLLDGLSLATTWVAFAAALSMGALTGFGATATIRALSKDKTGEAAGASDYLGKTARVVVPMDAGETGKVRVQIKGHDVDVLAIGDGESFDKEEEVLIIEMEGSQARIARLEPKSKG